MYSLTKIDLEMYYCIFQNTKNHELGYRSLENLKICSSQLNSVQSINAVGRVNPNFLGM